MDKSDKLVSIGKVAMRNLFVVGYLYPNSRDGTSKLLIERPFRTNDAAHQIRAELSSAVCPIPGGLRQSVTSHRTVLVLESSRFPESDGGHLNMYSLLCSYSREERYNSPKFLFPHERSRGIHGTVWQCSFLKCPVCADAYPVEK
jgi:hypothetical protein